MASVRMTNQLRHEIAQAANEAYSIANPQPQPSTEMKEFFKKAFTNSAVHRLLGELITKAKALNMVGMDVFKSELPAVTPIHKIDLRKNNEEFELVFDTPMHLNTYLRKGNHRWGNPTLLVEELDAEYQTEARAYHNDFVQKTQEHHKQRAEYRESIANLLGSCTTLKQLLEIWPAAESLIPSEKLQQLHTKVTRKERAQTIKKEINFDPTIANQAVLTSKMLGV